MDNTTTEIDARFWHIIDGSYTPDEYRKLIERCKRTIQAYEDDGA
jgi:hypothetical protein